MDQLGARRESQPLNRSEVISVNQSLRQSSCFEGLEVAPGVQYHADHLYYKDPDVEAVKNSKSIPVSWKDISQQKNYFELLKDSGIFNSRFYGGSKEPTDLKASYASQNLQPEQPSQLSQTNNSLKYDFDRLALAKSGYIEAPIAQQNMADRQGIGSVSTGMRFDNSVRRQSDLSKSQLSKIADDIDWRDPKKQPEYFRVLRESGLLNEAFYGVPEKEMDLRLSHISMGHTARSSFK